MTTEPTPLKLRKLHLQDVIGQDTELQIVPWVNGQEKLLLDVGMNECVNG